MDFKQMQYSRSQTGFGIIEIMIALALGIIIMLGVTQIATSNSQTRWELDKTSRQIESASYALHEIESDVTNAGFWGEMGAQPMGVVPPICADNYCDATSAADDFCEVEQILGYPVQGGQGQFDCITQDATDADKVTPKAGSDYLSVRRASSCALGDDGCDANVSNIRLQVNACFRPDVASAPLPGIDYLIGTDPSVFVYQQRDCDAANLAPEYRILNRIYFVNNQDQLVRMELEGNEYVETVLVDGIEMLRFEYGLDSSGDGQVDEYTDDPNDPDPTAWTNVVMVRISMLVRSPEASAGFSDTKVYTVAGETYCAGGACDVDIPDEFQTHRRQLYARTVSMRNVAGRRE
jgi:type IV pilus assembly protein PilW